MIDDARAGVASNLSLSPPFLLGIFAALVLAMSSGCKESGSRNDAQPTSKLPSEEQVIETAKGFLLAYLEEHSSGVEHFNQFFILAEPEATYHPKNFDRWNVFFTNGLESINIALDRNGKLGTMYLTDGRAFTNDPKMKEVTHPDPVPLFSLSDFREVVRDTRFYW